VGPGYLTWLGTKGFTSSQFTSFSVEVADDTYVLGTHPDLPAARVAFQNNPTNQTGVLGGHGFLNAHIIGGFNNGTGAANEDGARPQLRPGQCALGEGRHQHRHLRQHLLHPDRLGEHGVRPGRAHLQQLLGLHRRGGQEVRASTRRSSTASSATRRAAPPATSR